MLLLMGACVPVVPSSQFLYAYVTEVNPQELQVVKTATTLYTHP